MGKPQRRRKVHFGDTHLQRRWRTRSRKRDLDQVFISPRAFHPHTHARNV